ncbi:hypothetical protein [Streptomyces sp. NPDC021562]|uniref:hypothetical protein n=1 Tax=Streptomyces sp. NPDC021562 TaxID=3155121 RepID=UPI0010472374
MPASVPPSAVAVDDAAPSPVAVTGPAHLLGPATALLAAGLLAARRRVGAVGPRPSPERTV